MRDKNLPVLFLNLLQSTVKWKLCDDAKLISMWVFCVVCLAFHCWYYVVVIIVSSKRGRERERKETRDEINLGTDLFPGCSQVSTCGFFTKLNPKTVEWIKCMVDHFILLKIKIFTFKMTRNWLLTFGSMDTFTWLDWKLPLHLKSESFLSFSAPFWDCFKSDCLLYSSYPEWSSWNVTSCGIAW